MVCAGLVNADQAARLKDHDVVFDAEAARPLLENAQDELHQNALARYINASVIQTALLIENGILKPFVDLSCMPQAQKAFARKDADAFLQALHRDAEVVEQVPSGTNQILRAARKANCAATEIVNLILARKLRWVGRMHAETGFMAILVNVDEVKERVRKEEPSDLSVPQIMPILKLSALTIRMLIDRGYLPHRIAINPVKRGPMKVVPLEAVLKFHATYVSLFNLAEEMQVHFRSLQPQLRGRKIEPAIPNSETNCTFYLRADIADLAG